MLRLRVPFAASPLLKPLTSNVGRLNNASVTEQSAVHHPQHDKPCGAHQLCGVTNA